MKNKNKRSMEKKARKETYELTNKQLEILSASIHTTCPALARFYLLKKKAREEDDDSYQGQGHSYSHCSYCSAPYLPGSHNMRILPKMKLTAKIRRLMKKHAENPGSLGKFQQKLVNDYVTGRNRLAAKCLFCQKTVNMPGQSRQERYSQTQTLERELTDVPQVPKTRKEKLKEKKKKMKKKKKAQLGDTDPNAGLTIRKGPSAMLIDSECDDQETSLKERDGNQPLSEKEKVLAASSTQKAGIDLLQDRKSSTNQKTYVKNIQNQYDSNKRTASKSASNLNADKKVLNLKPTAASSILSSEKKKKVKNLHQQLGNILKQENNKIGQGSLADFLSSL